MYWPNSINFHDPYPQPYPFPEHPPLPPIQKKMRCLTDLFCRSWYERGLACDFATPRIGQDPGITFGYADVLYLKPLPLGIKNTISCDIRPYPTPKPPIPPSTIP